MKNKKKDEFSSNLYRRMFLLVLFIFILLILLLAFLAFVTIQLEIFNISNLKQENILLIVCSIIAILIVSQGVMLYWSNKVIKPLKQVVTAMEKVSNGDFNVKIDTNNFTNEFKVLGDSLNNMIEELKSIEVMRSDFVSNVSHEFKAPLSAIQGYVTLLSNPMLTKEQYKKYFDLLAESTRDLSGLVENVLKLSRLESQNMITNKKEFSLDEQIRQVVLMFENTWTQKNINLDLDLPETFYYGNEDLLKQIWTNLFSNALKFTDKNGNIAIKIEKSCDNKTVVSISDNGIGIDEEGQKHLFEKFYQGDTSRRQEGNGLGLALVKTICDLTNSEIKVNSKVNIGTKFTVILP